jgi:GntR family transcriptional repressor for pyruvate dehydrogenase complex
MTIGERSESQGFQAIRRGSLVEEIIDSVKQEIVAGRLVRGQRLPSELELAERFQVSRGAVREAMKTLQAIGVVTIERGNGTHIVDRPSDELLSPLIFALLLEAPVAGELIELREMFQVAYSQLAARSVTAADWDRIEAAQARFERYADDRERDPGLHTELDLNFHFAVLDATHNPLIVKIGRAVEELYHGTIRRTLQTHQGPATGITGHRDIIAAIRGGDPETIRQVVHDSLAYWAREVELNAPPPAEAVPA